MVIHMKGGVPIAANILVNLEELGIGSSCFRFGSVTLEGDKYVGVKETSVDGGSQIVIVDTSTKHINRKPMKAESALIHPLENILVVRGQSEVNGCTVQIFNLGSKEKLGAFVFPESIVYWRWLNSRILAIIGDKAVYHWTINGGSNTLPLKIFERSGELAESSTQVVGYQCNSDQRWCMLMGLSPCTIPNQGSNSGGVSVKGQIQLFSAEKRQQQLLEGFSGSFGEIILDDFISAHPTSIVCFIEKKQDQLNAKLHIMDISTSRAEGSTPFKMNVELPSNLNYNNPQVPGVHGPGENSGIFDFPIYSYISNYFGVIFIITRGGILYVVEPSSGSILYFSQICQDSVFLGSPSRSHGICVVNRRGLVLHVMVNSNNISSYIQSNTSLFSNQGITRWLKRYGYSGSEDFSTRIFNEALNRMDYVNAFRVVALNKSNYLRVPATLNRLKMLDNSNKVLLYYFICLLQYHILNQFESLELVHITLSLVTSSSSNSSSESISTFLAAISAGSVSLTPNFSIPSPLVFLRILINEDKLTLSEDLGDLLLSQCTDKSLALKVFSKCTPLNPTKILHTYIEIGNYDDIINFILQHKDNWPTITTDIRSLLNNLLILNNINACVEFVRRILLPCTPESVNAAANLNSSNITNSGNVSNFSNSASGVNSNVLPHGLELAIDKISIVDIFISHGHYKEITSILLDYLKNNRPEDAALQTKLFELNLLYAPQVAEALFQMDVYTYYDKHAIASLCEKAGLFERCLENYTDMRDIRRILSISCGSLNSDWLANYLSKLPSNTRFECLKELLSVCRNQGGNINSGSGIGLMSTNTSDSSGTSLTNTINNSILQNLIQVCIKNIDNIGIENIITLFEQQNLWEGIYYVIGSNLTAYLGGVDSATSGIIGNTTTGPSISTNNLNSHLNNKSTSIQQSFSSQSFIIFKYIEASINLGQVQEAERICRDFPQSYDPDQVIEYFKNIKMNDLRPLIWVCDLHHRVEDLINYLYHMSLYKYIQVYALKINPSQTPLVIGTLIDLDGSEDLVKSLLQEIKTLGSSFSFSDLIQQAEKRNRLKLLLPWLEERVHEGYQDPSLHNALAKIYIDMNRDPENFLKTNPYYDSKLIGDYCEDRDPYLAYIAYRKAWGLCDDEIIQVTYKNDLYRLLARYLVERQDLSLWSKVLGSGNKQSEDLEGDEHFDSSRQLIIDQVISSILPEFSNKAEEVSCTIRAFINADIPTSLLELLEKIVLHINNAEFTQNKNLQNLLLLTAIKVDPSRLDDYILRLDNYDAKEVAKIAIQHNILRSAFQIYKKFSLNIEAMEILLQIARGESKDSTESNDNLGSDSPEYENSQHYNIDLSHAFDFAVYCNDNSVWSLLGRQYLNIGRCKEAVECYIKSENTKGYQETIDVCLKSKSYQDLMNYLQMVRRLKDSRISKDPIIDTELAYCMSKLGMIQELQNFLQGINTVQLQRIGDRLMDEGLFKYSIIFYQSIPNYSRLTTCYIQLEEYNNALESAKKANSPKTWKELLQICMQIGEYNLAHQAGLNIIVYPDYCEDVVNEYENKGLTDELLTLLEGAIQNTERAHGSLFTELGILYAKYTPEKLMDYCSNYSGRINIPKLIRICEQYQLWNEVVYLFLQYHEYDQAVLTIINHADVAWKKDEFISILQNISNLDILYKSITFYLDKHPELLNDLLMSTISKNNTLNDSRMVNSLNNTPRHNSNLGSVNMGTNLADTPQNTSNSLYNSSSINSRFDISSLCTRLIQQYFRKTGTATDSVASVALIQEFLESVCSENILAVNEALIDLYLNTKNVDKLQKLIMECDNYNQSNLSRKLESHPLNDFRRLAVKIFHKNADYQQALEICQKEMLIEDAIVVVYKSADTSLIENLLEFLLSHKNIENFIACLYTCYEYLKPDVILELAWKYKCLDAAMPFFIQCVRDLTNKVENLEKRLDTVYLTDIARNNASGTGGNLHNGPSHNITENSTNEIPALTNHSYSDSKSGGLGNIGILGNLNKGGWV
ncbi:clathrin heavy chain 1, putative [Cryptosporidium muris RN66]|uniref:Clathrin heavy chain n=1 Tax=Cryptosporidium muris (strain RN66) TaxID=441375 RepID=B6AAW2_CRYMR|nr:clathrin heavy chain 1, putative [Cryptosporidium muris RN66]EEA05514.1 clathrin heavy chain 1, putative [Cryptosporidium muris RN66]|eukprot:XP_002139863.1 clathrin heavy chain 1 [Cryptosporidium muris RN66]